MLYLLLIPVMGLANRIRGYDIPGGAWMAGGILGAVVAALTGNIWASALLIPAFVLGESFGWTKYISTVKGHLTQQQYNEQWADVDTDIWSYPWDRVASLFVDPRQDYEKHTNIGMALRGVVFIAPVLIVLCAFGLVPLVYAVPAAVVGGIAFPMTYKFVYGINMLGFRYLQKAETTYGCVYGAILAGGLALGVAY